jgi:hypothetical protein
MTAQGSRSFWWPTKSHMWEKLKYILIWFQRRQNIKACMHLCSFKDNSVPWGSQLDTFVFEEVAPDPTQPILWRRSHWFTLFEHLKRGREYVTLQKIFFTSKCRYSLCVTQYIKPKGGQQNRWGTTNSKPQGPIINDGPIRNTEQQSDPIYYTLLCKCTQHCCAFNQPLCAQCAYIYMLSQNQFSEPKPTTYVGLSFIQLYLAWSHSEHRLRCSMNFAFSLKHFVLLGTYMGGIRHGCYFNVDKEAILIVIHTNSHFPKWLYLPFCLNLFLWEHSLNPLGTSLELWEHIGIYYQLVVFKGFRRFIKYLKNGGWLGFRVLSFIYG